MTVANERLASGKVSAGTVSSAHAAAEWFALLRSDQASEADHRRWRAWLDSAPEHRRAWTRVEAIGRQFERLPQGPVRQALESAGQSRRQMLKALAMVGSVGLMSWGSAELVPWQQWSAGLSTGVGERKQLTLADGTRLWLNTRSAADAEYGDDLRRIVLHEGEVLIESGKDASGRPLVVDTAQGRVRAIGTRFSVWQTGDVTRVSVFEGAVLLSPRDSRDSLRLSAGQQSRFTRSTASAVQTADANRAAWSKGMLIADNMRLGDFIDELARYRSGRLGCDAAVADLRLVGAYPLADTDRVLAAIESTLPVRQRGLKPWWTVIASR